MTTVDLSWKIRAQKAEAHFRYQEEIAEKDAIIELLTAKVVEVTEELMR